mmetsp:Transcript_13993/g.39783  ORF Transcript_13993/g.39783 Transcript_13993/m.39783 type:complete len:119 (+) Transcript_13993:56-412(+)
MSPSPVDAGGLLLSFATLWGMSVGTVYLTVKFAPGWLFNCLWVGSGLCTLYAVVRQLFCRDDDLKKGIWFRLRTGILEPRHSVVGYKSYEGHSAALFPFVTLSSFKFLAFLGVISLHP